MDFYCSLRSLFILSSGGVGDRNTTLGSQNPTFWITVFYGKFCFNLTPIVLKRCSFRYLCSNFWNKKPNFHETLPNPGRPPGGTVDNQFTLRASIRRNYECFYSEEIFGSTFFYPINFLLLNASYLLSSYFRNPSPPEDVFSENLERLKNTIESGLAEPLMTHKTVEMRHDVFRKVVTRRVLNLNTKIWLSEADFDSKYFPEGWHVAFPTKRGDRRTIIFPIVVRLFLGRSHKLYSAKGQELPRRWTEKLTITFVKQTHWK